MAEHYELKQVRVYLKEATPLYSDQAITSPESAIRIMSEVLDRIEKDIDKMKKKDRINRERNESVHPGKDPAQVAEMNL